MAQNNSHFPALEGELIVRGVDGSIREKHIIGEMPLGKGTIIATVTNPEGQIVSEDRRPFRSFVNNMALMMLNAFEGATENMIDTSNATANTDSVDVQSSANDDTHGIQVGRNTATGTYLSGMAETVNKADYALRQQCEEGTGVNELTHGATVFAYTNGLSYMSLTRTFTNSSAAQIDVKEIAITGDSGSNKFMLSRDIDESVEVPWVSNGVLTKLDYQIAIGNVLTIVYLFEIADSDGLLNSFLGFMASLMTQAAALVNTCDINTSGSVGVSVDFHTNPTYALWSAAGAADDQGFLVGTNTVGTDRAEYELLNIEQTVTYAAQDTGTLTYPAVGGRIVVSNNNYDFEVYKTFVTSTRVFTNGTGSAVTLEEGAIALAGSATNARVPIIRFKFPAQVQLNTLEALEMTLKISMITNVVEK